jgi:hypothetical protein
MFITRMNKVVNGVVLIIGGLLGELFLKNKLNITKRTNTMSDHAKSAQFFTLFLLSIIS